MPHELILVCGNAGVGKTTLAKKLAASRGATLLDIDTVAERLVQAGLRALGSDPDDRDSPTYKQIYREPIHETLLAIARDNLQHNSCVVVAPFTRERKDPHFRSALIERMEVEVRVIYVVCDEETRRKRIILRNNPRDAYKLGDWHAYALLGRDDGPPPFLHELVDTSDG